MAKSKIPPISDSTIDILASLTDTGLEILGLIPGASQAIELANSYRSAIDNLFARKVARFIETFSVLSAEDRAAFFRQFSNDDELERFGETVLLLLDKSDEIDKPIIIGRLYRAAATQQLTLDAAQRLSAIVNRGYLADLNCLSCFESETSGFQNEITASLNALGLIAIKSVDYGRDDDPNGYQLSGYGKLLLDHGLRESA